ncbi:MAG: PhnD/SsuA/transferrin family substrate-binding protein, partial [SAR324 cluster bacterium]|nr:PhnD/SsuA/transferrin family substrate-binding protein [SAR324 cluster bacterium]
MLKKSILLLIGVPIFFVMFLGNNAMSANCENPDSLTFAMIPTEETVAELNLYKPITDRMAELTGKKINFFMPTSYASVVEGLLSRFVDVAVLGPYTYV